MQELLPPKNEEIEVNPVDINTACSTEKPADISISSSIGATHQGPIGQFDWDTSTQELLGRRRDSPQDRDNLLPRVAVVREHFPEGLITVPFSEKSLECVDLDETPPLDDGSDDEDEIGINQQKWAEERSEYSDEND